MSITAPPNNLFKLSPNEPHLSFPCSFEWSGYCWRIFGSRFFYRPLKETFAEFLEMHVKLLFGNKWWKNQQQQTLNQQHIVYRWAQNCHLAKQNGCIDQKNEADGSVSFIPSGPILSWLSFGYDLICLSHKKLLSPKILNRLKHINEFQGAWFEVAVAATTLRAGCDIKWIKDKSKRNCEFIATHKATGIQFGVEAKSKRRSGTYNESGLINETLKSCSSLVESGLGQTPDDLPFILFVDINAKFSPGSPFEKPVMKETVQIINQLDYATPENPDKFSVLIATNFGFHYGDIDSPANPPEHCDVIPSYTKHMLPMSVLNDITASIKRYGLIPEML